MIVSGAFFVFKVRGQTLSFLNYHHLQYFWLVAKEGHLTRSAQKLRVSQSALSAQIKLLEDQLGQQLFVREGRSLRLSEVGREVFDYAETIFSAGNELLAFMKEGRGLQRQVLRVGSVSTLSRNFQEQFLNPLLSEPSIQWALRSGNLEELLDLLGKHNLHLILSNKAQAHQHDQPWRCQLLARQPVCLVGKPRPTHEPFRFPNDLIGQKLILPGPTSEIRAAFDLLCERYQLSFDILAEVDDMAMLRLISRDTSGIALLPAIVVQDELQAGRLELYSELPGVYEHFYAITAVRRSQHPLVNLLLTQSEQNDSWKHSGLPKTPDCFGNFAGAAL